MKPRFLTKKFALSLLFTISPTMLSPTMAFSSVIENRLLIPFHFIEGGKRIPGTQKTSVPFAYYAEDLAGSELMLSSKDMLLDAEYYAFEKRISKSVFEVWKRDSKAVGTAWYVTPTVVMTNRHVYGATLEEVQKANRENGKLPCGFFRSRTPGDPVARIQSGIDSQEDFSSCKKVVYCSSVYDYCLIEMDRPGIPLPIRMTTKVQANEALTLIGNSKGLGIIGSRGQGLSFRKAGAIDSELPADSRLMVHYAPSFDGSSGSPVLDDEGSAVGVNYGNYAREDISDDALNLAVPGYMVYQELKNSSHQELFKAIQWKGKKEAESEGVVNTLLSFFLPDANLDAEAGVPVVYTEYQKKTFKFLGKNRSVEYPNATYNRCSRRVKKVFGVCGEINKYAEPNRDFKNQDLRGMLFVNSDLTNADFSGANLRSVNMIHIKRMVDQATMYISGANFENADLEDGTLINAGMEATGVNFKGANLKYSNIGFGLLEKSDFANADVSFARLNMGTFRNINFSGAKLQSTVLSDSRFFDSQFSGTATAATNMKNAVLADTILIRSDIRFVNLSKADIRGLRCKECLMDDTTLVQGAVFDQFTKLPWSRDDLEKRGAVYQFTNLD